MEMQLRVSTYFSACCNYLSHIPDEKCLKVLDRAWEVSARNYDTADAGGDIEDLIGRWFKLHHEMRYGIFLISKFAGKVIRGDNCQVTRGIDSLLEYARKACQRNLQRLGVGSFNLYHIYRLHSKTPVDKTIVETVQLKKVLECEKWSGTLIDSNYSEGKI